MINAYTSNATNGIIRRIVTEQMLREAVAVLLNTALLNASWASQFDKSKTSKAAFEGVESPVDFMHKSTRLPYVGNRRYQSIQLNRNDSGIVQIILPRQGIDLARVVVNVDWLLNEQHYPQKMNLTLPRVAVSGSTDCGKLLDIEVATLTGLGLDEPSLIGIHQAATVQWNEMGVKAAAATVVRATRGISSGETMAVDRPFVFFMREPDGTVSFAGTVYNPLG